MDIKEIDIKDLKDFKHNDWIAFSGKGAQVIREIYHKFGVDAKCSLFYNNKKYRLDFTMYEYHYFLNVVFVGISKSFLIGLI